MRRKLMKTLKEWADEKGFVKVNGLWYTLNPDFEGMIINDKTLKQLFNDNNAKSAGRTRKG